MEPLVSIIIVNFNGLAFLYDNLRSVLNTNYPNFEIILVDNASTDESVRFIKENFHGPTIIENKRNLGFARGNNVGIQYAKGKYVAFLNTDTVVDKNWLLTMVHIAEKDSQIGACQSKLLSLEDPRLVDGTGDFILVHGLSYIRDHRGKDVDYRRVEEIFSGRAAALLVRRDILEQVGLFDETYFNGYEDVDLCWRIRLRGYKIVLVPQSVVYHAGRASTKKNTSQEAFHKHKNYLITITKNYSGKNLIRYFLPSVLVRLLVSISPASEVKQIYQPGSAGVKASLWFLGNFKYTWRKRLIVQHFVRKVSDSYLKCFFLKSDFEIQILRWFLFYRSKYDLWSYAQMAIMMKKCS
jgi:hypothetical protein